MKLKILLLIIPVLIFGWYMFFEYMLNRPIPIELIGFTFLVMIGITGYYFKHLFINIKNKLKL